MSNHAGSTGVKRRDFLKVLGASGAAVATVGCSSEKVGNLVPYLIHPDETVAGVSTYYATTCRECAASCGLIAETRDGRVTKLEGNPEHPLNRGALCARGQSAVQGLYNPDRLRGPMVKEGGAWKAIDWDRALTLLSQKLGEARSRGGAASAVFLNQHETGSFPVFLDAWLAGFGMRPHLSVDFEADSAVVEANRAAYGVSWPRLSFQDAKLIVSFGADFLDNWGMSVPQQLDFADARADHDKAPRLIYVGPRRSLTGLNADQWIDGSIDNFITAARASQWDGAIMTFPNTHPRWSYARLEDGLVVAVAEKQPISRHATAGLYYFRRGVDFVRGAERMLFKNASLNGEFYVAPVFNELILAGQRVGVFPIDAAQMHGLGTPEEVERFQARLYAAAS